MPADAAQWMEEFHRLHGRRPRVLHVGNIANNAYLNAKFMNARGFDCDVLCYNYYHIMGCPEWEDGEFRNSPPESHFAPRWWSSGLAGFERPRWFVQGPQALCLQYLLARREGRLAHAERLWQALSRANRTAPPGRPFDALWRRLAHFRDVLLQSPDVAGLLRSKLAAPLRRLGPAVHIVRPLTEAVVRAAAAAVHRYRGRRPPEGPESADHMAQRLEQSFEQLFAPRRAVFKQALQRYRATLPAWQAVMSHYDAVIGYATDGIYPLLAGMRPYVAFEHGTIRSIPFVDDADGQLCALTYRMADGVIITNADNITAARKLGLATYRFVPHPVNDEPMADECARAGYEKLHADLGSDFVVFHPARQHWEEQRHPNWEKGNDIFLKGFAAFVKTVNPRASAVLVNWGASVPESRALIDALGIASRVRWVEPLPHREMMRMIRACDAVADQFFLGAFGSTTPKALACAKPVLLRLDVEAHRWCFPDPPPVVNARDEREVLSGLDRLYRDPGHYQEVCRLGQRWYERWHSSEVVTGRLNDIVREVIQHG